MCCDPNGLVFFCLFKLVVGGPCSCQHERRGEEWATWAWPPSPMPPTLPSQPAAKSTSTTLPPSCFSLKVLQQISFVAYYQGACIIESSILFLHLNRKIGLVSDGSGIYIRQLALSPTENDKFFHTEQRLIIVNAQRYSSHVFKNVSTSQIRRYTLGIRHDQPGCTGKQL